MSTQQSVAKYFEAILGRDVSEQDDGVVLLRDTVAAYSPVQNGSVTSREIGTTGDSTKACGDMRLLDVSGIARTDADGSIEFLLSDYLCGDWDFRAPVNVVATPLSSSPVYVTINRRIISRDIRIAVRSWDANGRPVPLVSFDWRCRAAWMPIIE